MDGWVDDRVITIIVVVIGCTWFYIPPTHKKTHTGVGFPNPRRLSRSSLLSITAVVAAAAPASPPSGMPPLLFTSSRTTTLWLWWLCGGV